MVRPSASNLTGWQRRRVKAKASARWELLSAPFSATRAALTRRLSGREWGAFFLLPAMQATSTLLRSSSTKQRKAGPATTAARQLLLFSLPEPSACCWDLICPEEAWEQPLRWAV